MTFYLTISVLILYTLYLKNASFRSSISLKSFLSNVSNSKLLSTAVAAIFDILTFTISTKF